MRLRFKSRIRVAARLAWIGRISLILLALVPVSLAQTAVTGGLNGVVKDSTGAVVPGATVTIVNTATGDTRVLTTNAAGRYSAPFLKPGAYRSLRPPRDSSPARHPSRFWSVNNPRPISPFRLPAANKQSQ